MEKIILEISGLLLICCFFYILSNYKRFLNLFKNDKKRKNENLKHKKIMAPKIQNLAI